MKYGLEEERRIQKHIDLWRVRGWIPEYYRKRIWMHLDVGILWQRDTFGVYYGISNRLVMYICQRADTRGRPEGFWEVRHAKRKRRITSEDVTGEPIAVFRKVTDAMRATELYHLDRQSTGKWIGL